jgi:hypothetical protein
VLQAELAEIRRLLAVAEEEMANGQKGEDRIIENEHVLPFSALLHAQIYTGED